MANTARLASWRFDTVSLIKIVLCFYIAFAPVIASAGAAEKLAFLDLKNVARTVSGVTADYRFAAANAEIFEAKAVQVTNSELGQVWRNRWAGLSRGVGVAGLAVAAVAGLLEAVDWILDPANNRIYKKVVNPDGFIYQITISGVNVNTCLAQPYNRLSQAAECVTTAASSFIDPDNPNYRHLQLVPEFDFNQLVSEAVQNPDTPFSAPYYDLKEGSSTLFSYRLSVKAISSATELEVEATPQDIADAISSADDATAIELAQSPDYDTEQHTPTLAAAAAAKPPVTPPKTCVAPATLVNNQCVTPDKQVKPTPDGGFEIPAFCGWATTVCEFMDWYKTDPVEKTPDQTKVDVKDRDINDIPNFPDIDTNRVRFSQQCPAPISRNISLMGHTTAIEFKFDVVCDMAEMFRPYIIGLSYLTGAYIVLGINRNTSE